MSFCVECGVELADYHKKCPLCETPVHNPRRSFDFSKNDYPVFKKHHSVSNRRRVMRRLTGFILTMCFLMGALIPIIVDLSSNRTITWAVFPIMSMILLWISIAFPFFKKRNTFFGVFTTAWYGTLVLVVLVDLVTSGVLSWSRYVLSSMALVWVLMSGIFMATRIRKYVPVLLVYIVAGVGYFILLASWLADSSAVLSLVLPLEGALLLVFLVTYFIIRSKLHGAINYIILFLVDALILSLGFDLIITQYTRGVFRFTWSVLVALALVPIIIVAVIIHNRWKVHGVISKRLHR